MQGRFPLKRRCHDYFLGEPSDCGCLGLIVSVLVGDVVNGFAGIVTWPDEGQCAHRLAIESIRGILSLLKGPII